MILFSDILLTFFNRTSPSFLFDVIGLTLLVFSLFVWYVASKQLQNEVLVKLISFLDILWVMGSLIIIAFQLFNLSVKGYMLISIVAIWIGFLAYRQLKEILKYTK
ncbi:MAG: hypothetical protein COA50_10290 [Flavobacteriaceae bacterium]|nr:MAG: hypothetical protein COA50_10290 [Flavobacteriaceae bacterium]